MGLTDEVLEKVLKRQKKSDTPPTALYQQISAMKEFNLTPAQWRSMPGLDRRILMYHRVMESHYISEADEEMKRDIERTRDTDRVMSKMPQQQRSRRW